MDKIWVLIAVIVVVIILIVVIIMPNSDKLLNLGTSANSKTAVLDSVINDSSITVGASVRQIMQQAKKQGAGFLVDGSSGLTTSAGNGAVDFTDSGTYQTGRLYVVVNYLPTANGTYAQTTNIQDIMDNATFKQTKRLDANGKINRITFTQVDQGN